MLKPLLMHPDRDFCTDLPANHETLAHDLDLNVLLDAMSRGDEALFETARGAIMSSATSAEIIGYRHSILADCLRRPESIRQLHEIAVTAVEGWREHRLGFFITDTPNSVLSTSVRALAFYLPLLRDLRQTVHRFRHAFAAPGLVRFAGAVTDGLSEDHLRSLEGHLERLRFPHGVLLSASLGADSVGADYALRLPHRRRKWVAPWRRNRHSFPIPTQDDNAQRALWLIRGKGVARAAQAVAEWNDSVFGFFGSLRTELGFYVACLNLYEHLAENGRPVCFPNPGAADDLSAEGLYDICLALRLATQPVGNEVDADGKRLMVITGVNGGGKSTFLRSIGVAQMMMRAGMFVTARSFRAGIAPGIFTHFTREEEPSKRMGKLEEELNRMDQIVDLLAPGYLLLCNESFSSTNEREGSEIAHQVVSALTQSGVRVLFVTHMYELARRLYEEQPPDALFLRADRRSDGTRTFKLRAAEPLSTSFGRDIFSRVFDRTGRTPADGPGTAAS